MLSNTGTDLGRDRQTPCTQCNLLSIGHQHCKAQRMSAVFRHAAHGTVTTLTASTVRSLTNGKHLNLNLPTLNATARHAARRLYSDLLYYQNSTRCHDTRINVT